jgi:hypothetical protein
MPEEISGIFEFEETYCPAENRNHMRILKFISYAFGNFANTIAYQVFGNRINFYYVDVLGLNAGAWRGSCGVSTACGTRSTTL